MDQKRRPSRDLSDLKARLGLSKPADSVPPPGAAAPPGTAQQPDLKRDPFATASPSMGAAPVYYQPIVDAGPPIDIPVEKKRPTKLIIGILAVVIVFLGLGYATGQIFHARILFNKTIDDANSIKSEVEKIVEENKKIIKALLTSEARNQNKILYDPELLEELSEIARKNTPDKARKQEENLFRTNYAMMEDILISRLFSYYNNTIRLLEEMQFFIRNAKQDQESIEEYLKDMADSGQRKYGIVFAEDKGSFFLGALVEVGQPICKDKKIDALKCKLNDIEGFMVRAGSSRWTERSGKPQQGETISDVVIPIIPDENWRQVAMGKKGYLAYKEYVVGFSRMKQILSIIIALEKPLVQDLGKAGGRTKLFTL